MPARRVLAAATLGSVLAGVVACSATAAPAAPQKTSVAPPASSSAPTRPTYVPLVQLPAAPPVEIWVKKRDSDFQQTLDLRMQTAMVERLNIDFDDVDRDVARALAYRLCTDLRAKGYSGSAAYVTAIYPEAGTGALGVILEAQAYCVDTA